jgi:glycosyltransferase involved in cell wall biosynthesis
MDGPVARQLGVPSLGYLRDIMKLSKQAIADINQLDRIIAVSNATRDWHCQQGIEADKTFVIYNGVDSDLFSPPADSGRIETICPIRSELTGPIRSELGISATAPVLLFVGQIGIRKGLDTLINAFLAVAERVPEVQLLIVGQRHSQKQEAIEYEQRLRQQTESSAHPQNIHWLGIRTDVPELMRASTILVHPARQEPLGRVLLEAAASGLTIVTTRVGGSPEIMKGPELESLLVEPNDPIELSARIVELINDPQRRNRLRSTLRKVAKQTFSIDGCARELAAHYRQLLD